ncbi:TPA: hypothetical protein ACHKXJ_004400, partial [Escherichia coli]
MTVNNMINNGFYAKSETFGGNGRRTPITNRVRTSAITVNNHPGRLNIVRTSVYVGIKEHPARDSV